MMESEILKLIKKTVREELAPILMGSVVANKDQMRSDIKRFSDEGPIRGLRNIQPFGLGSRPPSGTDCVVAPVNSDVTHLNILGHFDKDRPEIQDGETILYNAQGQQIYLEGGKIHIGKKTTSNPAPVGNELKAFLLELISWLETHTHVITLPGLDSLPPTQVPDLTAIQANNIDNDEILSDYIFVEKSP